MANFSLYSLSWFKSIQGASYRHLYRFGDHVEVPTLGKSSEFQPVKKML